MARGCLQGVKYLMFAFNLLFWFFVLLLLVFLLEASLAILFFAYTDKKTLQAHLGGSLSQPWNRPFLQGAWFFYWRTNALRNQDPGPLGWQHGAVWVVTGVRRHSPEGLCARPSPSIDRYAQRDLKKGLHLYGTPGNVGLTNAWSIIQTDFRCCGVSNYTDWFEVYNATRVPDSCCLEFSDSCGLHAPGTWWKAPCYETVKVWLQENLLAVGVFGLCTALVQILGLTFAMTMYCQVVKADTYCA
ncbi:tetraspanin-4 isoform X3 [Tursiops truncatus]|uniref:Tetraspanin n=1 Tax=Tursiops truncatus TaxID=9739 RepID=A0A6J3RS03_TURTR|nr:tetraspanin-4 isoform X2 [Tursiops truncatus]